MTASAPNRDPALLAELRAVALDAAVAAGELLLAGRPGRGGPALTVDAKSSPTDAVTEMDRGAEALVVARLLAARPDDGLLGEEGAERTGTSGVRWVVDPLDGTVNYLYGLAGWAVSVAAQDVATGESLVGVVHAPVSRETYLAVQGGGAVRRDDAGETALHVSGCDDLAMALVGTGFGYRADRRRAQARVLATVLPRVRDVRRLGAASLDLCAVAAGRLDGYYERGLQPWDHAAAGLVALEAGARVEGLHGAPASEALTVAGGPGIFVALHDLLASLDAASDH